jgi:prevent-host-death family protein
MVQTATMRELRNHTREVIERAQSEAVTITDGGVPIAVLTALSTSAGRWNADAWLDQITGADWKPYDSGLAAEAEVARRAAADEPDAADRLGLA